MLVTVSPVAAPVVVGFDLDMTLFDTRPGIGRVWRQMADDTGVAFDADLIVTRLGPPLATEMANWVPADRIDEFCALYRAIYPETAVGASPLLPGAAAAVDAVHGAGGRTMVVTAKTAEHAQGHVDHVGLPVDLVVGGLWGAGKGAALAEQGAEVYVGDHVLDVEGAHAAGALSVAVATGPCSVEELTAAGADVVLADLTAFADWWETFLLERRLVDLTALLAELGSVLVAFSGGTDSAFLLAAARRALGPGAVVAATAVSDSLPAAELDAAERFAAELGVRWVSAATHEIDRDGYRANEGDRCYFCKAELVDVLGPIAADLGIATVVTGTNADDARAGFRPGIRAAAERGAATPLLDAGLTKAQVRTASRAWGLSTWDKPAAACLSSRIAYGVEVTSHRLIRVERAETAVRDVLCDAEVAVRDLRVRDLGDQARVDVDQAALAAIEGSADLRGAVVEAVVAAGFATAYVDERGFRSGAMNELLADPEVYR